MTDSSARSGARPARLPDDIVVRALIVGAVVASACGTLLAAFPDGAGGLAGGIGATIGVFVGQTYRDRAFWRLPPARRSLVERVQRTGTPSGDAELDDIALRRLADDAKNIRSERVVVVALLAGLIALTVLAGVRSGPVWAVFAAPALFVLGRGAAQRWRDDPRPALTKLRAAVDRTD